MAKKIEYATRKDLAKIESKIDALTRHVESFKDGTDEWTKSFQSSLQGVSELAVVVNTNLNNIKRHNNVLTYILNQLKIIAQNLGILRKTQHDTAKLLVQVSKNVQRNSP